MRTVRNRYSRTPARTSYRLQTERLSPNVSKAYNKLLTRMIKDGYALEKIVRDLLMSLETERPALAQDLADYLYKVQEGLELLDRLDLDF